MDFKKRNFKENSINYAKKIRKYFLFITRTFTCQSINYFLLYQQNYDSYYVNFLLTLFLFFWNVKCLKSWFFVFQFAKRTICFAIAYEVFLKRFIEPFWKELFFCLTDLMFRKWNLNRVGNVYKNLVTKYR